MIKNIPTAFIKRFFLPMSSFRMFGKNSVIAVARIKIKSGRVPRSADPKDADDIAIAPNDKTTPNEPNISFTI